MVEVVQENLVVASRNGVLVRLMSQKDLYTAMDWAAEEGWNPGIHDAEAFHAADPRGFFMAIRNGGAVGCISAVSYDETFGFIGLSLVRPGERGEQFSPDLLRCAFEYLGERNIGVNCAEKKARNFEAAGFKLAHNNIRFEGKSQPAPFYTDAVHLSELPFEEFLAYDRQLFPVARPSFLSSWIEQPGGLALGIRRFRRLKGYGVIRESLNGYAIGPLFADSPEIAEELLLALISSVPAGESFQLDIPSVNDDALALAGKYLMKPVLRTARMYNRAFPCLPMSRIYGITSVDLG